MIKENVKYNTFKRKIENTFTTQDISSWFMINFHSCVVLLK